jgi:shikimate kinase
MARALIRKPATGNRKPEAHAVILIGFMGAGKSSVGRALSEHLGWPFEDLDQRVERREQRKVAEIFRDFGESEFRRAEHAALKELLSELRAGVNRIVASGGGTFVQKRNARLVENEGVPTVFLDAAAEELWQRCRRQADAEAMQRPLLGSLASFRELYEERRPHYLRASLRQVTSGKTVHQIAAEIVDALGLDRSP